MIDTEKILNALKSMSNERRVEIWNAIHGENSPYHIYRMDEINQVCKERYMCAPIDILREFYSPQEFTPYDEFWVDLSKLDNSRKVVSFNRVEDCPVYDDMKIIDFMEDTFDDLMLYFAEC